MTEGVGPYTAAFPSPLTIDFPVLGSLNAFTGILSRRAKHPTLACPLSWRELEESVELAHLVR